MNFIENLANYKLGFIKSSGLPDIAINAIEEGYESQNLFILAGMNKFDNYGELEDYLDKSLKDLNINIPSDKDSFNILLKYYLLLIKGGLIDFDEGMKNIYYDLILAHGNLFGERKKNAYDTCGLSILGGTYVYYSDVDEDIEGGYLYNKGVNGDELKNKYKDDILKEINNCLEKLDNGTLN